MSSTHPEFSEWQRLLSAGSSGILRRCDDTAGVNCPVFYALDSMGVPLVWSTSVPEIELCRVNVIITENKKQYFRQSPGPHAIRITANCQMIVTDTIDTQRVNAYVAVRVGEDNAARLGLSRLQVDKIDFQSGGNAEWQTADWRPRPNPFASQEELRIVEHMNEDHVAALSHYMKYYFDLADTLTPPRMLGIDAFGFHLYYREDIYRIDFIQPIGNTTQAREQLVMMARSR